jgi:hypothetical protein
MPEVSGKAQAPDARFGAGRRLDLTPGPVERPVVDEDELPLLVGRLEHRDHAR